MHYSDWASRWEEDRIGFHVPEVNPRLIRHQDVLLNPRPRRVLVPLCGKSLDLLWLMERADEVVGVELIPKAVHDFFEEHTLSPEVEDLGALQRFQAHNLTIYQGDFLALTPEQAGTFDAAYDRASYIALDPQEREDYRPHLMRFLCPGARLLLVTLDYLPRTGGPPYSVGEEEVRNFLGPYGTLKEIEHHDALPESTHLQKRGITSIFENTYRFVRNP